MLSLSIFLLFFPSFIFHLFYFNHLSTFFTRATTFFSLVDLIYIGPFERWTLDAKLIFRRAENLLVRSQTLVFSSEVQYFIRVFIEDILVQLCESRGLQETYSKMLFASLNVFIQCVQMFYQILCVFLFCTDNTDKVCQQNNTLQFMH